MIARLPLPPTPTLRRWHAALYDFVLPPRCAVCGRDGALLCAPCAADFPPAAPPRCPRCWTPQPHPLPPHAPCDRCTADPPPLRHLRAACVFDGAARRAVHAVKYRSLSATVAPMLAAADLPALARDLDLVTAVPMAARRRRRRGHNQAELFARALAAPRGLPFHAAALQRRRATPQQARQPDLAARRANVRHAFLADPARVRGRTVLVDDDVTTSGATLNACAAALLTAGATAVDGWAFCRED